MKPKPTRAALTNLSRWDLDTLAIALGMLSRRHPGSREKPSGQRAIRLRTRCQRLFKAMAVP
jgi:hypothetical protein